MSGLATCLQSDQVPYTAISESNTAQGQFIEPKYLPVGFRLVDPHNLKVERIREFFLHIKARESQYPPSEVFRFQKVHSTRRKGELVPTKYPGEFDVANPPFVKRKAVRRKKKAMAATTENELPTPVAPTVPPTTSGTPYTTGLIDLGPAHLNLNQNPTIARESRVQSTIIEGHVPTDEPVTPAPQSHVPSAVNARPVLTTPSPTTNALVGTQSRVPSAANEGRLLAPATITEELVFNEMLRFDERFLNVFDDPEQYPSPHPNDPHPYSSAYVNSSHQLGLVSDAIFNMSTPTPGAAPSGSQNFYSTFSGSTSGDNAISHVYQTPVFDESFSKIVGDGQSRGGAEQFSLSSTHPSGTSFGRAMSTGLPTPSLTPVKSFMSHNGSTASPRSILLKQQLAGMLSVQPELGRLLTPELPSPMSIQGDFNEPQLPHGVALPAHEHNIRQQGPSAMGLEQYPPSMSAQGHIFSQDPYISAGTYPGSQSMPLALSPPYDVYPRPTAVNPRQNAYPVPTLEQVGQPGEPAPLAVCSQKYGYPMQTGVNLPGDPMPKSAGDEQVDQQQGLEGTAQPTTADNNRAKRAVLTADARALKEAEIISGKRKRIPKKRG